MRISLSLLFAFALTGCFPHNAKHRKIAKWTEGATMVAGVLSQSKTGADCTAGPAGRDEYDDCRFKSTSVGGVGLGMVLAGLVGFSHADHVGRRQRAGEAAGTALVRGQARGSGRAEAAAPQRVAQEEVADLRSATCRIINEKLSAPVAAPQIATTNGTRHRQRMQKPSTNVSRRPSART